MGRGTGVHHQSPTRGSIDELELNPVMMVQATPSRGGATYSEVQSLNPPGMMGSPRRPPPESVPPAGRRLPAIATPNRSAPRNVSRDEPFGVVVAATHAGETAPSLTVMAKPRSYRGVVIGCVGILILGATIGALAGTLALDPADSTQAQPSPPPPAPGTVSAAAASSAVSKMSLEQKKAAFADDRKELGNLVKFDDEVAPADRGAATPKAVSPHAIHCMTYVYPFYPDFHCR